MWDIVRESALGQFARLLHIRRSLAYEEERFDFELPSSYMNNCEKNETPESSSTASGQHSSAEPEDSMSADVESYRLHPFTSRGQHVCQTRSRTDTKGREILDIIPTRTVDGLTLVNWYTEDDPANPQNWSSGKKVFVTAQICTYTFSVYIGSSLYTASEPAVTRLFGVSEVAAALGLALYGKPRARVQPNFHF